MLNLTSENTPGILLIFSREVDMNDLQLIQKDLIRQSDVHL